MPNAPHWYIVRVKCSSEEDFKGFVLHIRKHDYKREYKGYSYVTFDVGEYYYWTMGSPLNIVNEEGVLGICPLFPLSSAP
jgi:hypothetical protein